MLKQRIITAIILVIIVFAALMAENSFYWGLLINVAVAIGFLEWLRFCGIDSLRNQVLSITAYALTSFAAQTGLLPFSLVVVAACLLWILLFIFTLSDRADIIHRPLIKLMVGILLLVAATLIVIRLKQLENGYLWILCFFFCVWAADVGAYFVGKRFGKTKLAPHISPGKTVEGLLGGLAFAVIIFVPIMYSNFPVAEASLLLVTVLFTVLVSVLGDLFESKLKRHVGLKDSSQILPGHGGVLDRIDSLLSAAPFFALGLVLLGYAQ